jgi:hypothetical protein
MYPIAPPYNSYHNAPLSPPSQTQQASPSSTQSSSRSSTPSSPDEQHSSPLSPPSSVKRELFKPRSKSFPPPNKEPVMSLYQEREESGEGRQEGKGSGREARGKRW